MLLSRRKNILYLALVALCASAAKVGFAWTAVAKRKDAAQVKLPIETENAQFDYRLKDVMFNENNQDRKNLTPT